VEEDRQHNNSVDQIDRINDWRKFNQKSTKPWL